MKKNFTSGIYFQKFCVNKSLRKCAVLGLLLCMCLLSTAVSAQSRIITGTVTDSKGETLIGVGVTVKNSKTTSQTDLNGKFSIKVDAPKPILVFTYVGFQTLELPATGSVVNVKMQEDNKSLNEVVVVGYGTQSKPTITGSISSISGKEILRAPVSNIVNALAGRATGITTTQRSGEPGRDVADIYIRGIATFAPGNATPLILVDGVPRDGIATIDPYTIESLNILKDASATAVFGVRGANGVILITTKTGVSGKPQFSFSSNLALQNPIRLPKQLNSYDFAILRNEAAINDAIDAGSANPQDAYAFSQYDLERYKNHDDPYFHPDIDWFEYMLKDYAPQQQYNLNVSGGVKDAKYFVSLGYLNQTGAYKQGDFFDEFSANPQYKRYNVRSNFDFNVTKKLSLSLKVGTDLTNSNYSKESAASIFGTILSASPVMSPAIYDNKIVRYTEGVAGSFQKSNPPLYQLLTYGYNTNFSSNLNTNLAAKYDLSSVTKGLSIRAQVAYDNFYNQSALRNKRIPLYELAYDPNAKNFQDSIKPVLKINQTEGPVSFADENYSKNQKIYGEAAIDYKRSFGDHNVSGLILGTAERRYSGSNELPYNYLGLVGRVTYNYKGKYLAEFNMGYNGSENFAVGKQFGFFPAGSIGYVLTEESFIPKNDALTFLKLRASYGQVGNDKLGNNRFLFRPDAFKVANTYYFGTTPTAQTGYTEDQLGNSDVTWEVATKLNLGADFKFYKDKISLSTDYFTEDRSQILWNLNVPITFGNAGIIAPYNIGQASNKGFEIELGYRDNIEGSDFGYSINANYSFARNKIIYRDESPKPFPGLQETGSRINQPKGLQALGIYNTNEEITQDGITSSYQPNLKPGDIRYKDQNGDFIIDDNDYVNIGNPNVPEITYGVNVGITYKGFELNTLLQGADNVSAYLVGESVWPFIGGTKNAFENAKESWSQQRFDAGLPISLPRLTASPEANKHNYRTSSFWQQNAAYLRLKNVEFAYTFNPKLISKVGLKYLRVFINGQNLLTKTDMKYFDPEIANSNGAVYPMVRTFNLGTNIQF